MQKKSEKKEITKEYYDIQIHEKILMLYRFWDYNFRQYWKNVNWANSWHAHKEKSSTSLLIWQQSKWMAGEEKRKQRESKCEQESEWERERNVKGGRESQSTSRSITKEENMFFDVISLWMWHWIFSFGGWKNKHSFTQYCIVHIVHIWFFAFFSANPFCIS